MKVAKWGNSLAVRLPAELVERLGLKEGDEIELVAKAAESAVEIERKPSIGELMERVRGMPRKFPAGYKFDREEANRRRRPGDAD